MLFTVPTYTLSGKVWNYRKMGGGGGRFKGNAQRINRKLKELTFLEWTVKMMEGWSAGPQSRAEETVRAKRMMH